MSEKAVASAITSLTMSHTNFSSISVQAFSVASVAKVWICLQFQELFYIFSSFNPIPPRLFSNLFPLGGGRHVSHPVELHTKNFLHQNFSLSGLRVSIADFGFEGPGFDSQQNLHFH